MFPYFILILIFHINIIVGGIPYDELEARFDYLVKSNYKKWVMPKTDAPVLVTVSLSLYNYATIDEVTSEYNFNLIIDAEWVDPRLNLLNANISREYNASNTLEGGLWHLSSIWHPVITIINNQDKSNNDNDDSNNDMVRIHTDGSVFMRKRKYVRIYCNMDFRNYPFDQQKCFINFESATHSVNHLILRWASTGAFNQGDNFNTVGFSLIKYDQKSSNVTYHRDFNYSRITIELILQREYAHYLFDVYLPTGMIVMVSWCTFWLGVGSPPARVMLGVTTLLTLVTTSKNAREKLPKISYWNSLDIWNMVCIAFIFATVVEYTCIFYISTRVQSKKKKRRQKPSDETNVEPDKRQSTGSILLTPDTVKPDKRPSTESISFTPNTIKFGKRPSTESISLTSVTVKSDKRQSTGPILLTPDTVKPDKRPSTESITFTPNTVISAKRLSEDSISPYPKRQNGSFLKHGESSSSINKDKCEEFPKKRKSRFSLPPTKVQEQIQSIKMHIPLGPLKSPPQALASAIDKKCRIIFPMAFLIFNMIYWSVLLFQF